MPTTAIASSDPLPPQPAAETRPTLGKNKTGASNPLDHLITFGRSATVVLLCAGLLLSGCTTMRSVQMPVPASPPPVLEVGDHVELQTKGGQSLKFIVTQIEPTALAGQDVRVEYTDISSLKVRRVDKTSTITLSIIAGVGITLGLASLIAVGAP